MIVATVQGTEKGGKHITVKDGEKIFNKEQQKFIDELIDKVRDIEIIGNFGIKKLNSKEWFCYMEHPAVDIYNRKGIAFIVWDKNTEDDAIEKTIREIGFRDEDYIKFNEEYNKIKKEKSNKKKQLIFLVGIGMGLAAGLIVITLSMIKK